MVIGRLLEPAAEDISEALLERAPDSISENEEFKRNLSMATGNASYAYLYWWVDPGGSAERVRKGAGNLFEAYRSVWRYD